MLNRKYRMRVLRLVFLPIAVFLTVCFAPSWKLESLTEFIVEFLGYIFVLVGLVMRNWATLYIGGKKSRELVTSGPYSICRHPLYWGTFFLGIGVGLSFENIPLMAALLIVLGPIHYITAVSEEMNLERKFPVEYEAYKRRTPRLFPKFRNYHSEPLVMVSISAIRRVCIETIVILMIPQLEDLIEQLRLHEILPVVWHFP
jgi:protein-S-isoprenylcysteine O-methyltransferase Ste14